MFLTDTEIDAMCDGLTFNSTKCKHLRSQGLIVNEKPNGRPLVVRSHAVAVLRGLKVIEAEAERVVPVPARAAYILAFQQRRAA